MDLRVGDIVYLHGDLTKIRSRESYLVSAIQDVWASVREFAGSQLRAGTQKVCQEQCYKVPSHDNQKLGVPRDHSGDSDEDDDTILPITPTCPYQHDSCNP